MVVFVGWPRVIATSGHTLSSTPRPGKIRMQVRRVADKSRAYVGRKCTICNLAAKGGQVIVTYSSYYFTHKECLEQLLEKWDESEGTKPVSHTNRKQLKAERLEEEFEILRLKLLKRQTLLDAESTKMCMAQLERTDTVRCTYKSGHSGPHNPPPIYG